MLAEPGDGIRFSFGRNWKSFVATITPEAIAQAELDLKRLFPRDELRGKRFLDLGCGSGLSMLASLRLGAAFACGIDIDRDSVEAAEAVLSRHAKQDTWSLRQASVLELTPSNIGSYDIVYSWGVLHHTGDLWAAMDRAAALVPPDGWLAIALYRHTPLCPLWTTEKRIYADAPAIVQAIFRGTYKAAFLLSIAATGRSPRRYIAQYRGHRGMDWHHDVHDWLGGYPYESTDPQEVASFLRRRNLVIEREFSHPPRAFGIFGSHCDEYVARRMDPVDIPKPTQ